MIVEYTYLDAVKLFGCYIGTEIYIYIHRDIIMVYIKKEIFFKSMHQPNTLFYMKTYCGGICQCCTTNRIFLIKALNFKIYYNKRRNI